MAGEASSLSRRVENGVCVHLKPGPVNTDNGVAVGEVFFFVRPPPLFSFALYSDSHKERERGGSGESGVGLFKL